MDYRDTRVLTTVVTAYREYGGATAYGLPSHQSTNHRRVTVYRSTVEPRLIDYHNTTVLLSKYYSNREYGGATAYGLPSHQSTNHRRVTVYRSTAEPRLIDYHDTTVLISNNYCNIQIGSTVEPRLMDYRHTRVLTTVESRFIGARWSHGLLTTMTPLSSSQRIIVLFKFHIHNDCMCIQRAIRTL